MGYHVEGLKCILSSVLAWAVGLNWGAQVQSPAPSLTSCVTLTNVSIFVPFFLTWRANLCCEHEVNKYIHISINTCNNA